MSAYDRGIGFGWGELAASMEADERIADLQRQAMQRIGQLEAMIAERDQTIQRQAADINMLTETLQEQTAVLQTATRQLLDRNEELQHERHLHAVDEAWGVGQQATAKALAQEIRQCPEFENHHPLLKEDEDGNQPLAAIGYSAAITKARELGIENPEQHF